MMPATNMYTTTGQNSFDVLTPDSGVFQEDLELPSPGRQEMMDEWNAELAKTEDEIQTLRQVLAAKIKHAQDLKRRLGVTVWAELSGDLTSSLKSVRESETSHYVMKLGCVQKATGVLTEFQGAVSAAPLYQKTAGAMSAVTEKTGALFGGIGAKFGQLKETPTFKSFEERVGSVYSTAKQTKMTGSQSNSTQDFEEALREAEAEKVNQETTVAPTVDATQPAAS